jgi:hypothetical protein
LSALQSNLDELVFARIKFFTSGLPDDHEENIPRGYAGLLGSHQSKGFNPDRPCAAHHLTKRQ